MITKACLVCDQTELNPYLKGLLKCAFCGFVTADLTIEKDQLATLYGKDYFFGNEYVDYLKDKDILQCNFRKRLKSIVKYREKGHLLEVGCAYGFFLDLAKDFFAVKGYEICQDAVDYARSLSLDVECGDLLQANIPQNSFDVIVLWDVIEHLAKPHLYLEKSNLILNQNGLLCITTGDIGSLNARLRREKWRMIHPPTHLHYFSKDTLRLLLKKNGFQVVHQEYIGVARSVKQIAYSLLMLGENKYSKLYKMVEKTKLSNLQFSLNLRDIIFVIARKKQD